MICSGSCTGNLWWPDHPDEELLTSYRAEAKDLIEP